MAAWPLACENQEALDHVLTRRLDVEGFACPVVVQHNPARIRSTAAKVDSKSLAERPCFLCPENRPEVQQAHPLCDGWELLVNPYPILKEHYTIVAMRHQPQTLQGVLPVMRQAARVLGSAFMVFYNGPHCGASAPDHQHLQAGHWQGVPLVEYLLSHPVTAPVEIAPMGFKIIVRPLISVEDTFLPSDTDDVNLILVGDMLITIPRRHHRPACFGFTDSRQRLVSPGALDMCGLLITPRRSDFDNLTPDEARDILRQCGQWMEPTVSVGIMQAREIRSEQHPGHFTLHGVTIGKQFHWQQQEEQHFEGTLRLIPDGDRTWAVNDIPIEKYLKSVISSEMNPSAPIEFLKAHAIVSRSWLLAQLEHRRHSTAPKQSVQPAKQATTETPEAPNNPKSPIIPEATLVRWYDREDHTLFDVCADDHCQRYQGLARITDAAVQASADTYGQVLTYEGRVVDARFSKCCGGITEEYETCWDDTRHPELSSVSDLDADGHPFCDTHDDGLLHTILNNYDTVTHDFYHWRVSYSPQQLGQLIKEKTGIDLGSVSALIPIERGPSGRISRLRIVGTNRTLVVGKELEIRRTLSPTHLYSSRFTPTLFNGIWTLDGYGWGHGVGMCQIGAAVMASRGYTCHQIIRHYYPHADIEKLW